MALELVRYLGFTVAPVDLDTEGIDGLCRIEQNVTIGGRMVKAVLGGWQASAIITMRTGWPITIRDGGLAIMRQEIRGLLARPGPIEIAHSINIGNPWIVRSDMAHAKTNTFDAIGLAIHRGPGKFRLDCARASGW